MHRGVVGVGWREVCLDVSVSVCVVVLVCMLIWGYVFVEMCVSVIRGVCPCVSLFSGAFVHVCL